MKSWRLRQMLGEGYPGLLGDLEARLRSAGWIPNWDVNSQQSRFHKENTDLRIFLGEVGGQFRAVVSYNDYEPGSQWQIVYDQNYLSPYTRAEVLEDITKAIEDFGLF